MQVQEKAAEIAEQVISAYEKSGWTPASRGFGNSFSERGCAVGVLAYTHFEAAYTPYGTIWGWFGENFLADLGEGESAPSVSCFVAGFDVALDSLEEEQKLKHDLAYQVGKLVGSTVRDWQKLRGTVAVEPERPVRNEQEVMA